MSAETFSRVYALLADRSSNPDGDLWEHGPLQRLVSDLLAVTCEGLCLICGDDHEPRCRERRDPGDPEWTARELLSGLPPEDES